MRLLRLFKIIKPKRYSKETYNKYQREWRNKHKEYLREYQRKRYRKTHPFETKAVAYISLYKDKK